MPKLSVYVQDDLWERVKREGVRKGEKANNSQLVQRALEAMLDGQAARTAAASEGAVLDRDRFERVLSRMREGARVDFEQGYVAALEFVEAVGFEGLNIIVNYENADMSDALDTGNAGQGPDGWDDEYAWRFNLSDPGSTVFRAGANRAIRDLWNELSADQWGTDPATDGDDAADGGEDASDPS